MTASALFVDRYPMAANWVMVVSEMHRYQGVSYKSDIIVISGLVFENVPLISDHTSLFQGLDPGDRQVLEQKYSGSEPPCLLDTSDGR